jgi:hypothetical protein
MDNKFPTLWVVVLLGLVVESFLFLSRAHLAPLRAPASPQPTYSAAQASVVASPQSALCSGVWGLCSLRKAYSFSRVIIQQRFCRGRVNERTSFGAIHRQLSALRRPKAPYARRNHVPKIRCRSLGPLLLFRRLALQAPRISAVSCA